MVGSHVAPSSFDEMKWYGFRWFPWFRVYGPEEAIFDKSWRLPDIELVN